MVCQECDVNDNGRGKKRGKEPAKSATAGTHEDVDVEAINCAIGPCQQRLSQMPGGPVPVPVGDDGGGGGGSGRGGKEEFFMPLSKQMKAGWLAGTLVQLSKSWLGRLWTHKGVH